MTGSSGGDQAHGKGIGIDGHFQSKLSCDPMMPGLTGSVTASLLQLCKLLQCDSLKEWYRSATAEFKEVTCL